MADPVPLFTRALEFLNKYKYLLKSVNKWLFKYGERASKQICSAESYAGKKLSAEKAIREKNVSGKFR